MKRISHIFLLLLIVMCGCKSGIDNDPNNGGGNGQKYVKTSVNKLTFTASGGEQSFTVSTNADEWSAGSRHTWYKCSQNGNTVTVTVDPNTSTEERTSSIHIWAGDDLGCDVDIVQTGKGGGESGGGDGSDKSGTADGYNPYPNEDFVVNDNTMFLRDEVAGKIVAVDSVAPSFTLSKDTPAQFVPKIGDHYVVNNRQDLFPNGLLAMVQEVTTTPEGYVVRYSKDGLNAIFKDLHIEEQAMDISSAIQAIYDVNGNAIPFGVTKEASSTKLTLQMPQIGWDIGAGFEFTPKMTVDMTLKFQLIMDSWRISTLNFVCDTDVTLGADVAIGLEGTLLDYYKRICSVVCGAIPVGPILITPKIDIYAIFMASGGVSFEGSVSYMQGAVAKFHYDEINSVSGDISIKDNGKFEYSIGPKISGKFDYGLGVGPSIGIYGDVVSAGISMSCLFEEEISHKGNIANPVNWANPGNMYEWGRVLQEGEYATAFVLTGNVNLMGLGFPVTKSLKDVKFPVETVKLLPSISKECEIEVEGNTMTFKTWVKNKSLVYPELRLVAATGIDNATVEVPFDFGAAQIQQLENKADSVLITATTGLKKDARYEFGIYATYLGMDVGMQKYNKYVTPVDRSEENAILEILLDLYGSRVGEWKGCNWTEDKVGAANMKNVTHEIDYEGYSVFNILIPAEWKLTSNIHVGNHSGNLKNFRWNLDCEGSRTFSKVDIEDPCSFGIFVGDNCDTYIYHSALDKVAPYIPDNVQTLDLAGCKIESFSLSPFNKYRPKKVILDKCQLLQSISIGRYDMENLGKAPMISAQNCPKLKQINFSNTEVDNGFLDNIENHSGTYNLSKLTGNGLQSIDVHQPCTYFTMYECTIRDLHIDANLSIKEISIGSINAESVYVANCSALTKFGCSNSSGSNYKINSLEVTNAHQLKELYCYNCDLTSLEASNLDTIEHFDCRDNKHLCREMLPVFDQMIERGHQPYYDVRYEYSNGKMTKDKGYGFYYSNEPDRGYHRK